MKTRSRDNTDNCYGNEYPSRRCLLVRPTVEDRRPEKTRAKERSEVSSEKARAETRLVANGAEQKKPAQPRTRKQNVRDDGLVRSHRLEDVISE
jgi:hypothetical protein